MNPKHIILHLISIIKRLFPEYKHIPSMLILAQVLHETGNLKSAIFLENNNLFGMKFNKRGWAIGINRGHAVYNFWWSSIFDYFERQRVFKIIYVTPEQYVKQTALSGYAEDIAYQKRWLDIYYGLI
jgi:hypothetical protein